jgi:4-aminobutyrate aminotransferase-like enzyme
MNAIEIVNPDGGPNPEKTAAIVAHLFSQHILVYTCGVRGNVIRFMPPLNVEEAALQEVIAALEQSFLAVRKK